MIEIVLYCVVVGLMAQVARMENRSAILWGGFTALVCVGTVFIPLAFLRVLIAAVVSFLSMTALKMVIRQ
ncbi:MAG TPA: hypothetical protein VM695_12075 [Phycisphaerae bacterium]|nr:hypothetical protein [Phycisphaerae bacterium]